MNTPENTTSTSPPNHRNVLQMTHDEAKQFFLKPESYCNFDLPSYFDFQPILTNIDTVLKGSQCKSYQKNSPKNYSDVNYSILSNKNGAYAWRPFELIHPAIYVSLVNLITNEEHWKFLQKRFEKFTQNPKIQCSSIPLESLTNEKDQAKQINHWWSNIEQVSIELALEFNYLYITDVTDCYGAVYTHSIPWAIHSKSFSKNNQQKKCLGNLIDQHIQDMANGQTNGIPQGSVLMDFIAEIILGYADGRLCQEIKKNKIEDYKILRYRDDYRIFVNNPQDGEKILKYLTGILAELNLKLNPSKTTTSHRIITSSIKKDKLKWLHNQKMPKNLQKHLLLIHDFSTNYPNSGSVRIALQKFHLRIKKFKKIRGINQLISITTDIAYHNPATYPVCVKIIHSLLKHIHDNFAKHDIITKIKTKFDQIPNTGHLDIWLQMITWLIDYTETPYNEQLCKLVSKETSIDQIWNNRWINSKALLKALETDIVNHKTRDEINPDDEALLFAFNTQYF